MKAKQQLIQFLKTAPKAEGGLYSFTLTSSQARDAKEYVHRMRVELSRLRSAFAAEGRRINKFKVQTVAIEPFATGCKVTLRFCNHITKEISADLAAVIDVVANQDAPRIDERKARGIDQRKPLFARKPGATPNVKIK